MDTDTKRHVAICQNFDFSLTLPIQALSFLISFKPQTNLRIIYLFMCKHFDPYLTNSKDTPFNMFDSISNLTNLDTWSLSFVFEHNTMKINTNSHRRIYIDYLLCSLIKE